MNSLIKLNRFINLLFAKKVTAFELCLFDAVAKASSERYRDQFQEQSSRVTKVVHSKEGLERFYYSNNEASPIISANSINRKSQITLFAKVRFRIGPNHRVAKIYLLNGKFSNVVFDNSVFESLTETPVILEVVCHMEDSDD